MTNFFASDEYSYRHFFYKREHLAFSNLPWVFSFDFKFDYNF